LLLVLQGPACAAPPKIITEQVASISCFIDTSLVSILRPLQRIMVAFGATIAPQARAQQSTAPGQQMQPNQKAQDEADKSVKTRNSGESGFVADQEKAGASAHPPGQPEKSTTGTGSASDKSR
jgi:hypothetical protein